MIEIPVHPRPRKLAAWINPTGAKKVPVRPEAHPLPSITRLETSRALALVDDRRRGPDDEPNTSVPYQGSCFFSSLIRKFLGRRT
jgi:hypothetical protein